MDNDKPTILVIDDLLLSAQPLDAILGEQYTLLTTSSGKEGMELAKSKKPDLILLGVNLPDPDFSGLETCTRLKIHPDTRSIPILLVADASQDTNESQGINTGAMDYITRPFKAAILQARIHNYLELSNCHGTEENLSTIDHLTGIPNRRHFDIYLKREWGRAIRIRSSITIVAADVDCFKAYNENYGYQAGDDCLRQLAIMLYDNARRPTDIVAHYHSGEFICLFPDTDLNGGLRLARQMLEKTRELNIPNAYSPIADHVTLSFGVATLVPEMGQQPIELIYKAESQMRLAKHNGRNQVIG